MSMPKVSDIPLPIFWLVIFAALWCITAFIVKQFDFQPYWTYMGAWGATYLIFYFIGWGLFGVNWDE